MVRRGVRREIGHLVFCAGDERAHSVDVDGPRSREQRVGFDAGPEGRRRGEVELQRREAFRDELHVVMASQRGRGVGARGVVPRSFGERAPRRGEIALADEQIEIERGACERRLVQAGPEQRPLQGDDLDTRGRERGERVTEGAQPNGVGERAGLFRFPQEGAQVGGCGLADVTGEIRQDAVAKCVREGAASIVARMQERARASDIGRQRGEHREETCPVVCHRVHRANLPQGRAVVIARRVRERRARAVVPTKDVSPRRRCGYAGGVNVRTPVPLWVRALQKVDRIAWASYRAQEVLRDEVLLAWLDPALRDVVTQQAYRSQDTYLPGGHHHEHGLFDWEEAALAKAPFPQPPLQPEGGPARWLVTAAGGGREARVLAARGFSVDAFEPNDVLLAGAREVAARHPSLRVHEGDYADFGRAARGEGGPLAAVGEARFDAVLLGWGSITHLVDPAAHRALLDAVKIVAPKAPVLVSFFLRTDEPQGRAARARLKLKGAFQALGGRAAPPGLLYETAGGFVYWFTEREIRALAEAAGYVVVAFAPHPFPHAVLLPLGRALP